MAVRVSGVTVAWGGNTLDEPFSATLELEREAPVARTARWTLDLGTVTVKAFSRDVLPESEYGNRKRLTLTALDETTSAFTVFDADCVYLGATVAAEVNDVWRFDHRFRVMDTVGGTGSYPA
jgi:hypothetical protein